MLLQSNQGIQIITPLIDNQRIQTQNQQIIAEVERYEQTRIEQERVTSVKLNML